MERAGEKNGILMKDTDTLGDILRKFDISILQLRRLNPGRDVFSLGAGDAVDVPVWPETSLEDGYYILGAGDTLAARAEVRHQRHGAFKSNPNLRPQEFAPGSASPCRAAGPMPIKPFFAWIFCGDVAAGEF